MDFNPRFMGQPGGFFPAGGPNPNGSEEENNGRPPFEIVRHPDAPPQLPFAIRNNITGGFVTGSSPLFPRVFATPAEAHAALQDHLQSSPVHLSSGPAHPFVPGQAPPGPPHASFPPFGASQPAPFNRATTALPGRGGVDRFGRTVPPIAPAVNTGFGAQPGAGVNTIHGIPGMGSAPGLQLTSNRKTDTVAHPLSATATNAGAVASPGAAKGANYPQTYYEKQVQDYEKPFARYDPINPMSHMSTGQISKYKGLLLQRDQSKLADSTKQLQNYHGGPNDPYTQHLQRQVAYDNAKVNWDHLVGTMPGNDPDLWNCAVGAQQFLYAFGMNWKDIPHTESAGGMRSIVSSKKADWQQVSRGELKAGDLIFIPVLKGYDKKTGKRDEGSGWHVCVYTGSGNLAIQADSGSGSAPHYIRLVKYRNYDPSPLRVTKGKKVVSYRDVEYYRFTGPMDTNQHDVSKAAPWKYATGKDKDNSVYMPPSTAHGHNGHGHHHAR